MVYLEQLPAGSLTPWVESLWISEAADSAPHYRVPPDGCLDIVYSPALGPRAVGAMTVEQRFAFAPGARTVGVRFRPGMAGPFLRVAAAELTDRTVPLSDLWGRRAGELERQLDGAPSGAACLRVLETALQPQARPANAVQSAIGAIAANCGQADLDWIAAQANLSPRQFRRRCLEESGLAPKLLCRVLRFRRASSMSAGVPRPDWAAIALEAGYFDQAHLIRDFREFTGWTPMAVFSNTASQAAR